MKKVIKFTFIIGALLVIVSLITSFLSREVWVLTTGVTLIFMGLVTAIMGILFWHNKNTPASHHLPWIGIGAGMLLFSIGTLFRVNMAGSEGTSTEIFITTDYFIIAAYAFLTAGYYFFMSRAGNIIDEIDKLKIIWGAGIFLILVFDLYIAIQSTEIFGKTTAGLLVNIYYVSLDLIMVLFGITYLFAFYDGRISRFFKLVFVAIFIWTLSDIIFVLRGSYTENVSFLLVWLKILSVYLLVFAERTYAEIFTP